MYQAGRGDYRPVESPLTVALSRQTATTVTLLTTKLGLTLVDTLDSTATPIVHPGAVASYQLYPGGKLYSPPVLQTLYGSTLENLSLGPDPVNNPLGVFRSSGTLVLDDNVQITGTLISETTASDVQISGTNVTIQAVNLPKLNGSNAVYQLPALLVRDNLTINPLSSSQVRGFAMVWDDFEIKRGSPDTQFTLLGRLATAGLLLRGRDTWTMTATAWNTDYTDYTGTGGLLGSLLSAVLDTVRSVLGLPAGATVYFPEYMKGVRGFDYQPTLTIQPDSSGVQLHWHTWSQPLFEKAPADEGLTWEVIRWEENPL
jgi:hypothetical protein